MNTVLYTAEVIYNLQHTQQAHIGEGNGLGQTTYTLTVKSGLKKKQKKNKTKQTSSKTTVASSKACFYLNFQWKLLLDRH